MMINVGFEAGALGLVVQADRPTLPCILYNLKQDL